MEDMFKILQNECYVIGDIEAKEIRIFDSYEHMAKSIEEMWDNDIENCLDNSFTCKLGMVEKILNCDRKNIMTFNCESDDYDVTLEDWYKEIDND